MRTIFLLALVLGVGGCNDRFRASATDAYDLADAAQANARTALGRTEEQGTKLDELDSRIRELERELEREREFRQRMDDAIGADFERFVRETYGRHTH